MLLEWTQRHFTKRWRRAPERQRVLPLLPLQAAPLQGVQDAEEPQGRDGEGPEPARQIRGGAQRRHSQKLDEVISICSWSALWTDATKRKVDRCLQRLQTAGIKTGAKVSDVTLADLSQKILSEREVIQRRWDLVQKFKRAKMTTEDCIAMSLHMDKVLPAQILTSFQSVDPTSDLASGFVQGFCEGAWMDLSFLRVIGKALQSDGANETLPKVVSLTMADIYLNQDKLGQRLRAHLQCQRLESSRGEFDG